MFVHIDQGAKTPIYLQLRNQIVAAIAAGELAPGDSLPSVRSLAGDLGINLHTVNKAYASLRDEGYLLMRGRAGAVVASPLRDSSVPHAAEAERRLIDGLTLLALEHKAGGGGREGFAAAVASVLDAVYGTGAGGGSRPVPSGSSDR
ncbi:MAG: GntR family transcriptional regulator [Collinsella sp.]|nr:GntR family transcriptional regulator [Collinsella sp.]